MKIEEKLMQSGDAREGTRQVAVQGEERAVGAVGQAVRPVDAVALLEEHDHNIGDK